MENKNVLSKRMIEIYSRLNITNKIKLLQLAREIYARSKEKEEV